MIYECLCAVENTNVQELVSTLVANLSFEIMEILG